MLTKARHVGLNEEPGLIPGFILFFIIYCFLFKKKQKKLVNKNLNI